MKYPYPDHIKQLKLNHELQNTVTWQDEYYYREQQPVTEEDHQKFLRIVAEVEQKIVDRDRAERNWKEKNYEGTEIRDHYNH